MGSEMCIRDRLASFVGRISLYELRERSRGGDGGGDDEAFESGDDDICASNAFGKRL